MQKIKVVMMIFLKYIGLLLFLTNWGCAGQTHHVIIEDIEKVIENKDTIQYYDLSFVAKVGKSTIDSTRGIVNEIMNLPIGRHVTIYAYESSSSPETGNVDMQAKYVSPKPGHLMPLFIGISLKQRFFYLYSFD